MEREKDFEVTKMRHFAKLHERIHNKYIEMQKKLEKSKSVDSLMVADNENSFQVNKKSSSTNDLIDEIVVENGNNIPLMHTVIVEVINKLEVAYTSVDPKEASVSESENSANTNESEVNTDCHRSVDAENYGDDIEPTIEEIEDLLINDWKPSNESLSEPEKKDEEKPILPPTPKTSIRSKIGSRISAVRERRRESKERNLLKKKSELLETGSKSERLFLSSSTKSDLRLKDKRFKIATLTIALIEVTGLEIDLTEEKHRHLQCRFKLGQEKYKSKHVRITSPIVKWQELFHMDMYDENCNFLEILLLDIERKGAVIGKTTVNLSELESEKTHVMKIPLEGSMANAELFSLLTISGSPYDDLLVNLEHYHEHQRISQVKERDFGWFQLNDFSKVGRLSVIVYGAKGLASLDCYCTLKLINEIRQTHTEFKTNEPNWMKSFVFNVTDVSSILHVSVNDERKGEEVGRIAIPLLQINNDDKVWYALKDETLRERAKGINPRILLELRISWNIIKASVQVINPKENDLLKTEDEKFDRKLFFKNIARAKPVVFWTLDFLALFKSCFEWESRKWNTIFLIFWLLFNWYFNPWMVPLLFLIPFAWYRPPNYYLVNWNYFGKGVRPQTRESIERERRTLWKKINNLQDLIFIAQKLLGKLASLGESIKNLFNFSVPYLSVLAIFFLISISLSVYLIPVKYILMGWGIKKYVRKIIWPNRVSYIEVLELISRVPDDEVLNDCEMLPLELTSKERLTDDVLR